MMHKRAHPRKETVAKIRISWQAGGRGLKEWGMVQDRSTGGLGVKFPSAIAVGSVIAIAQGFTTNFGIVRHCSRINNQFFLGIEFCELEEGTKPFPRYDGKAGAGSTAPNEVKTSAKTDPQPTPGSAAGSQTEEDAQEEPVSPPPSRFREDFAMSKPPSKL